MSAEMTKGGLAGGGRPLTPLARCLTAGAGYLLLFPVHREMREIEPFGDLGLPAHLHAHRTTNLHAEVLASRDECFRIHIAGV